MSKSKDWYTLPLEVVTNGETMILIEGDKPPRGEVYHCDSNDCGRLQVVAWITLNDEQQVAIHRLMPAEPEKPPGLQEQAVSLSWLDIEVARMLVQHAPMAADANFATFCLAKVFGKRRERDECRTKLVRLGLLKD